MVGFTHRDAARYMAIEGGGYSKMPFPGINPSSCYRSMHYRLQPAHSSFDSKSGGLYARDGLVDRVIRVGSSRARLLTTSSTTRHCVAYCTLQGMRATDRAKPHLDAHHDGNQVRSRCACCFGKVANVAFEIDTFPHRPVPPISAMPNLPPLGLYAHEHGAESGRGVARADPHDVISRPFHR